MKITDKYVRIRKTEVKILIDAGVKVYYRFVTWDRGDVCLVTPDKLLYLTQWNPLKDRDMQLLYGKCPSFYIEKTNG